MGWQDLATSLLFCAIFLKALVVSERVPNCSCFRPEQPETTLYDFTIPDLLETRNISLSEYRGKVVLIVNVATYCGLTLHYPPLNELKSTFNEKGFEILGFPCNQFLMQEPGRSGEEILHGIQHVRPGNGFNPNFQLFKKIDVNGENEHPVYTFLKKYCPPTREEFAIAEKLFYTPMKNQDIRWNFEKILVDRNGMPVMRYDPFTEPKDIVDDIHDLIKNKR